MPFTTERFSQVPGATPKRTNGRYALWSGRPAAGDPAWCMEVLDGDEVQGWFLSTMTDRGLKLTLAKLRRDAQIAGLNLFGKAMIEYALRGATMGRASFSASNLPLMNACVSFGARLDRCEHSWLWTEGCNGSHDGQC